MSSEIYRFGMKGGAGASKRGVGVTGAGPVFAFWKVWCLTLALLASARAEEPPMTQGWSQDLLARLLSAPVDEQSGAGSALEGVVLRSYQLRVLRLGQPGRATHLVSILRRMLPADSRVTEDAAANTLHVLATVAAQQSVFEFVSAMDEPGLESAEEKGAQVMPEEVRKALEALAAARPESEQLARIVEESARRTEERVTEWMRSSQEQTEAKLNGTLMIGGASAGLIVILAATLFSRASRRAQRRDIAEAAKRESSALALLPTQGMESVLAVSREQQERTKDLQKLMESFSIAYQADRQRNTMMMEAVAKKHGDLVATLDQMNDLRRELGESAGRMFLEVNREAIDQIIDRASATLQSRASEVGLIAENASRKMEETATRLEVQNLRAEALANELERTQQEVDALFEKLKQSQDRAEKAQVEANEQRRIAFEKSAELARREAALAGLSILMQEPVSEILDTVQGASVSPAAPGGEVAAAEGAESALVAAPAPAAAEAPPAEDVPPRDSGSPVSNERQPELPCPPSKYTFRICPIA